MALDTGEDVWGHAATSFDNNGGIVVPTGDAFVVAPFGGAWLEVVDARGQVVATRDHPAGHGQVNQLSRLPDGRLVATGDVQGGGVYVEFVDGF